MPRRNGEEQSLARSRYVICLSMLLCHITNLFVILVVFRGVKAPRLPRCLFILPEPTEYIIYIDATRAYMAMAHLTNMFEFTLNTMNYTLCIYNLILDTGLI
jgi:hypothetical protein